MTVLVVPGIGIVKYYYDSSVLLLVLVIVLVLVVLVVLEFNWMRHRNLPQIIIQTISKKASNAIQRLGSKIKKKQNWTDFCCKGEE